MKATRAANKVNATIAYEDNQKHIDVLIRMIVEGLKDNDRINKDAGINWAMVGSQNHTIEQLTDIRDRLCGLGEYKE